MSEINYIEFDERRRAAFDHRAEPAYYPRPDGISDEDWDKCFVTMNRYRLYMGPARSGSWTVESLDKAIDWQQRRMAGIPYIHRKECSIVSGYCWVVNDGEEHHFSNFKTALRQADQIVGRQPVKRALARIKSIRSDLTKLGVDL